MAFCPGSTITGNYTISLKKNNALNLFRSHLSNRKQVVQIGDNQILCMFLQGSPPRVNSWSLAIYYNLYINDLTLSCAESDIDLYADDSAIYKSGFNINKI